MKASHRSTQVRVSNKPQNSNFAAATALENGRLHAELRARLEELRGSRERVIEAGQEERQRLERNLHDGAQQRLIALSLELDEQSAARPGRDDAIRVQPYPLIMQTIVDRIAEREKKAPGAF